MVYFLRNMNSGETTVLGVGYVYTLGRSRISHILLQDYSCSHKHAEIEITKEHATIQDVGSKRGIFIHGKKVSTKTILKDRDVIRFGLRNCNYLFFYPTFKTVIDKNISGDREIVLLPTLDALDVTVSSEYTKTCTHYTIEVISLDILKTTCFLKSLIDQKPMVTVKFWLEMIKNLEEAPKIPNIYRYMPEIEGSLKEKGIGVVMHKKSRKTLFKDVMCIFSNDYMENTIGHLIVKCGGQTISHNKKTSFAKTLVKNYRFKTVIIVKESPEEEQSLTISYCIDKLREYDKIVHIMSDDDLYITILKGVWDIVSEVSDKNIPVTKRTKRLSVINEDDLENQPGPSNPKVLKKIAKSNLTKLDRWITKKRKTKSNQNLAKGVSGEETNFDVSLDLTSDDDAEISVPEKKNNESQFYRLTLSSDTPTDENSDLIIISEEHGQHSAIPIVTLEDTIAEVIDVEDTKLVKSSTNRNEFKENSKNKKPSHPAQIEDIAGTSDKDDALGPSEDSSFTRKTKRNVWLLRSDDDDSETEDNANTTNTTKNKCKKTENQESSWIRLTKHKSPKRTIPWLNKPSKSRNIRAERSDADKNQNQHPEEILKSQELNIDNTILEIPDSPNSQKYSNSKTNNNNGCSKELNERVCNEEKSDSQNEISSKSTPEGKKKRLKVNPFAKQNTSASKGADSAVDVRRLNKMFEEVDFVPL